MFQKKQKSKKAFFITLAVVLLCAVGLLATYEYWDFGNYSKYDTKKMAMYNFNEGNGTATHDDSGRSKTGSLYGNASWTNERDNNLVQNAALNFDGYGDYVRVSHSADFDISSADVDGFVISAMIKVPADCNKTYLMICSKYYRYGSGDPFYDYSYGFTFYLTNGKLRFSGYNGQADVDPANCYANIGDADGADLRDGQWHFVAVKYLDGIYRLYVDPNEYSDGLVEEKACSVQPGNNTQDFFIGKRNISWDWDKDFEGKIDFLYFYEIDTEMINAPHNMWGNKNVGYWSFDEGNDTPDHLVNDFVRWTDPNNPNTPGGYHSYGIANGPDVFFLDRGCAWKGEHCIEFNNVGGGLAYVNVPDPNNYLDFTAPQYEDDIYIEMHIMPNNIIPGEFYPLVCKWDELPTYNGYRVFLDATNYNQAHVVFEVARNGVVGSTMTTTPWNFYGDWHHIVAWVQSSWMHLFVKNETTGVWNEYTINASPGIGASNSDLYFGTIEVLGSLDHEVYYDGWMDEVVIGHEFPE